MIDSLKINIWGRDFILRVNFNLYKGESIFPEQTELLNSLVTKKQWIENAKQKVISYCLEEVLGDEENTKKDNIFSYIMPDYIFIRHEEKPKIAIMCNYRYDMEHGLAIVFDKNGFIELGPQDIIL